MSTINNLIEDQQNINDVNIDIIPEPEVSAPVIGIVTDCPRLNVRVNPRADADVICIIERDSKVMIDEEDSTKNFYKICTEQGIEGYCMKQFISISK